MEKLSEEFWSDRYSNNMTGWDLGVVSPPIQAYFDQVEDESIKILIPGCGNSYEAEYLWNMGFKNVHVIDLAKEPLQNLKNRVPGFPEHHLHQGDFFDHDSKYDVIVEQTMFCAIDPSLRRKYAEKVYELLRPGGKLVGLLFNKEFEGGPPYGGSKDEYLGYFDQFTSIEMEPCHNSIAPRSGSELFIKIIK
jgi:thiopurine S-methyltransferase